jgi:ribose 5-phosphate isomerase B
MLFIVPSVVDIRLQDSNRSRSRRISTQGRAGGSSEEARAWRARFGHYDENAVDYPDYARAVARTALDKKAAWGILICGSGVGVNVAANKFPGIRDAVCHDAYSAHQGVEHDDMNVLCLGARVVDQELAREIVRTSLNATFSGEEKHVRRLGKIADIEKEYMKR